MIRRFSFLCLIALLFSFAAKAQEIHVGKSKMVILDLDTVSKGGVYYRLDSLTVQKLPRRLRVLYFVVNTSANTISGKLSQGFKSNNKLNHVDSANSDTNITLKPGDSARVHANFEASATYFKKGNNIVVVWPTGTLFHLAGDSARGVIKVIYGSAGIFSFKAPANTDLKIFPQPAISDLHLSCERQDVLIKYIRVFDITGRQVFYDQSESITMIHANTWKAGAYIIEAGLSNGEVQRIQISKSR